MFLGSCFEIHSAQIIFMDSPCTHNFSPRMTNKKHVHTIHLDCMVWHGIAWIDGWMDCWTDGRLVGLVGLLYYAVCWCCLPFRFRILLHFHDANCNDTCGVCMEKIYNKNITDNNRNNSDSGSGSSSSSDGNNSGTNKKPYSI